MTTRRALLRTAAAAALSTPLARAANAAASARSHAGPSEVAALETLIRREDAAGEAYALAARRTGDPLLARLGDHAGQHAAALRTELEALTVTLDPAGNGAALTDPDAAPLASAPRLATARAAAISLEEALVAAGAGAIRALPDAGPAQTATSVMAAHAQQLVALRLAAGRPPLDPRDTLPGGPTTPPAASPSP